MIFRTLIISLLIILATANLAARDAIEDSLKGVIEQSGDDSVKVDALIELCDYFLGIETAEAIKYGTRARYLAGEIDYKVGLAYALKSIGIAYYVRGDYIETLDYWQQSLDVFQLISHKLGIANMQSNLGVIYFNQGDDARALEYYLQSLKASEEIKDTLRIATALINIGAVHTHKESTLDEALQYYLKALPFCESMDDKPAIGTITVNIGEIYFSRDDFPLALEYFEKSLEPYEGTLAESYSLNSIGKVYSKWEDYDQAIEYSMTAYEIARHFDAKLDMAQILQTLGNTYFKTGKYNEARSMNLEAIEIAREIGANYILQSAYESLSELYSTTGDYENAFKYHTLFSTIKDTLFNIETDKKLSNLLFNFEIDKKQAQIDILYKDRALQELELDRQKLVKNSLFAGIVLLMIIAITIFRNYRMKVKTNKMLDKQKDQIESLLLNILPSEVAQELQVVGQATPRFYESVSVLFTDFKGFTSISKDLSPNDLVTELNYLFSAFDEITHKFNLEKIKTIGDAYMCAGGIPSTNDTHPYDIVEAGLALQQFMFEHNEDRRKKGLIPWELRVGIHTGPLVAGVVGKKKYAYDIWGSTVNVASRMESNGEPGKVNISDITYNQVKEKYTVDYRGKISAKNYGEIDMYFVSGYKKV